MSQVMKMTDDTERLLYDILQYVRASAVTAVRVSARSIISTQRKAKVYAEMTGEKTLQEIATMTGIPRETIRRYQVDFLTSGLASPPSRFQRSPRALFSVEELGVADLTTAEDEVEVEKKTEPVE